MHTHDRLGPGWLDRAHEAADGRVAATVSQLAEAIEDGHHLDAISQQLLDLRAIRLDRRWRTRRLWWRSEPRAQLRRLWQWLRRIQVAGFRQLGVFLDGHARQAEVVRDLPLADTSTQAMDQFTKVVHV